MGISPEGSKQRKDMKRYVSLEEITDGKFYKSGDLARTDCLGCKGCSDCCRGMGDTITLDPWDVYRLQCGMGGDLKEWIAKNQVALSVVDGVILPHLNMTGPGEQCAFLTSQGRCGIHTFRPGICRLFPLGRYYEDNGFSYILQTGECKKAKAKIRISKWLDIPKIESYEAFILEWHGILKEAESLTENDPAGEFARNLDLFLLNTFFMTEYDPKDSFEAQFRSRLERYRSIVNTEE